MNYAHLYQVIVPAAGSSRRIAHMTTDQPKSLLEIEGRSIIEHSLETLNARGFRRVTFIVGYKRDVFMDSLGDRYKDLALEYVVSEEYATTEHGWSLYLTRESWMRENSPVVFMDADNIYDPAMLDLVMASKLDNVMLVDDRYCADDREEELVLGRRGAITGLVRGLSGDYSDYVGGFVGINRFSADFMGALYAFMESFFRENGPKYKYERVFDRFNQQDNGFTLNYLCTSGLEWVNVNHEEDYRYACQLVNTFAALTKGALSC